MNALGGRRKEREIERDVMAGERIVADKIKEISNRGFLGGGAGQHFIVDAGQTDDFGGN